MQFKAMTWNIKSGHYQDEDSTIPVGKEWLDEIARVIGEEHPDAVSLQEVEVNNPRSRGLDQAREICSTLIRLTNQPWEYYFVPARAINPGFFGNVLLSRHPIQMRMDLPLPRCQGRETRCCLVGSITIGQNTLQVGTFHLGMKDEAKQAIMIKDWLLKIPGSLKHLLLGGDLNCEVSSPAYQAMRSHAFPLIDAGPNGCSFRCYQNELHPKIDFWFHSTDLQLDAKATRIYPLDISEHPPLICPFQLT